MLLATLMTVGVVMTIGFLFARGSGVSQAQAVEGDLLLDWATTDNTDVSVGTIDSGCQEVLSSAGTVRIDVVAVNANDWAGMDFVVIYPSPVIVIRPGPGDADVDQNDFSGVPVDPAAGFDFVGFDGSDFATLGSQNFMTTGAGSALDYSVTDVAPDGASPHGISMFDNALVGESGSGGLARLTLDISDVTAGFHTLSLGLTSAFAGGVHSDSSAFRPDNAPTGALPVTFASVDMLVDKTVGQSCAAGPPTPATATPTATPGPGGTPTATPTTPAGSGAGTATPTATIPVPAVGGAPGDGGGGNIWPIVLIVVGGVLVGVAAAGAIAQRLRQRTSKT